MSNNIDPIEYNSSSEDAIDQVLINGFRDVKKSINTKDKAVLLLSLSVGLIGYCLPKLSNTRHTKDLTTKVIQELYVLTEDLSKQAEPYTMPDVMCDIPTNVDCLQLMRMLMMDLQTFFPGEELDKQKQGYC